MRNIYRWAVNTIPLLYICFLTTSNKADKLHDNKRTSSVIIILQKKAFIWEVTIPPKKTF